MRAAATSGCRPPWRACRCSTTWSCRGWASAVLADGDQGLGEVVLDGDGVLAVGGDGAEGREGGAILGDGVALAAVEVGDEGEVVAHGADLGRRRVPAALVDGEGAAVVVGGAGGVLAGVGEGGVALLGVGVVEVVDGQDAADRGGLVGEVRASSRRSSRSRGWRGC
jgi:hypothetical protein